MSQAVNPLITSPMSHDTKQEHQQPVRAIPMRRVSFNEAIRNLPKHFALDGDVLMSHVVAAFSSVFPDGEDFFVRSVRHFKDQIQDPELKQQVVGFIGQEAIHSREHRALNKRLAEHGYPTKRMERRTRRDLKLLRNTSTPEVNLAVTAALEHFTATFAEVLLSDPYARELIDSPVITDLLLWHALEECEHKAVAFDVYKAVGGSEKVRVRTMNQICFSFILRMTLSSVVSALFDRETYRNGNFLRSLRQVRKAPWFSRKVWRRLRDYNRPDFHPNDHDTRALETEWREVLFGKQGRLNPILAATR